MPPMAAFLHFSTKRLFPRFEFWRLIGFQFLHASLTHLLFKNNVYHTSGSQGTPGGEGVDYVMMARGAGYKDAFAVRTMAELEKYMPAILTGEGPIFVELHTGLAQTTPMQDRSGVPFHQQVEKLRTRLAG